MTLPWLELTYLLISAPAKTSVYHTLRGNSLLSAASDGIDDARRGSNKHVLNSKQIEKKLAVAAKRPVDCARTVGCSTGVA